MDVVVRKYAESVQRLQESNANLVDKLEWNRRLSICKDCKHCEMYNKEESVFKCTKCGCPGFKFMIEGMKCPLKKPKWR